MSCINGRTKVCGLFGFPVEHSFSPAMHNAAFNKLGLNWTYLPFNVAPNNLKEAVKGISSLNIAGVNVTIPHKEKVIAFLDEIDPAAELIGAVNTIVNKNGKLTGYNTDGKGFVRSLADEANFSPQGKSALIIGCGGAARAVAIQLALSGLSAIYITNRTMEKAAALAEEISAACSTRADILPWGNNLPERVISEVNLVVQTTSIGMYPEINRIPEFPFKFMQPGQLVCDLIYNPGQTLFLRRAVEKGASTLNGLGMLLYQGVLAFELWTGVTAPVDVMRETLLRQVSKNEE